MCMFTWQRPSNPLNFVINLWDKKEVNRINYEESKTYKFFFTVLYNKKDKSNEWNFIKALISGLILS